MWLFSQRMMSSVGLLLNVMGFKMSGLPRMLMPISLIFGHLETIILLHLKNLHLINLSMQLSFSMILRISIFFKAYDRDWGRDTQIIVDLVLSPDKTFGNKTRLKKQARDGSGIAVILSA